MFLNKITDDIDSVVRSVESALGDQPDLVVDAAGTCASFQQCLSLLQAGGTALLIGNLAKEAPLPLQDVVSREMTLVGTYGFDRRAFDDRYICCRKFKTNWRDLSKNVAC